MSRQVILLNTVQEAVGKEKNNQSKQNILGCSFTSLKNNDWKSVWIVRLKILVMNWFESYAV